MRKISVKNLAKRRSRATQQNNFANGLVAILILGCGFVLAVVMINHWRQEVVNSQPNIQVQNQFRQKQQFVKKLAPAAVKYGQQYHVLPSVTLAQAVLESNWGQSRLASDYHNLFGVKDDNPQESQELQTQEYQDGQWVTVTARFKVYTNFEASIADHDALLANGTTWNKQQYQHVLAADNYVEAAQSLQKDGYATDPDYAKKLIKIIQTYNLDEYDTK